PAPPPPTPLGRYRVLSPLAGVRVSPLQLGAMSIGDKWSGMGAMDKEASFKLLDAFYDAGGNFIDTTNNYQDETSEAFIGEWAEKRGIRDQLVIATKYSTNYKRGRDDIKIKVNFTGNNGKSLKLSVEESLKKLRTSYIDILYMHWKVLYLGISDSPAWVVAYANRYAMDHGKTPFVIYQGAWNVMARSFERDIIPMARTLGLALAPWNVLAAGRLRTDAEEARRAESGEKGRTTMRDWLRNEDEKKMSAALEKVAKEVEDALCVPLIGGRKVEHLMANIEALKISLSDEQIKYIESVIPFDPGFPNAMIGDGTSANFLLGSAAYEDPWPLKQAIRPQ
ncbi:hypothetical protein M0805_001885, partial [Coniferiporia weirii]